MTQSFPSAPASRAPVRRSTKAAVCRFAAGLLLAVFCLGAKGAAADEPSMPLGSWSVQEIDGSSITVDATFDLAEDGTLSGSAGCNRYSGHATVEGERLEIGKLASTRMMCEEEAMHVEQRFFAALEKVAAWADASGDLNLLGAQGEVLVKLAATESPSAQITIEVPGADGVETSHAAFHCDGRSLEVEYVNAGPVSLALLTIDDEFVVASNVIAASGARYAGGRYIWWSKGTDEASLSDLTAGEEAPAVDCKPVQQ